MQPPVALAHDQPSALEHAHVPRDRRRRQFEWLGQLAHRGAAGGQAFEHVPARGVGQRCEHGIEWVGLSINHVVNYKHEMSRAARGKFRGA